MSLPAHEDWFSFSARRNRKSYLLANLMLFGLLFCIGAVVYLFGAQGQGGLIVTVIFMLMGAAAGYFLAAQRLRDIGLTGWLALLWLPVGMLPETYAGPISLAMFICVASLPGTQGENRYGPDPLQS